MSDLSRFPTGPFTIFKHQDQEICELVYVVQERRATDSEALKLWKGRSGFFFRFFPSLQQRIKIMNKPDKIFFENTIVFGPCPYFYPLL